MLADTLLPTAASAAQGNEFAALLEKQRAHFQSNVRHTTAGQRIDKLNRMKKWLLDRANLDRVRTAIFNDFRKPAPEVDLYDVKPILIEIEETKAKLHEWMSPKNVASPLLMTGTNAQIMYEPRGVGLIIGAWNFPFMLSVGPLVSAISAGCCAVVKPSEYAPHTAELIAAMVSELYVEEEVAVVCGEVATAQALLALPFDHIFFTGSPAVGKVVMHAAAEHLSSITLELGGLNPAIVDDTVSIKDVAQKIAWGKLMNCGQSCMSINYVLAHEKIYERLLREIPRQMECVYGKLDELHNNPDYGRIVNHKNFVRIHQLIEGSIAKGANVEWGYNIKEDENYISPTILRDVPLDAPVMNEEIFGPVLPVLPYSTLEEAVALINAKPRSLSFYVFSASTQNTDYLLNNTNSGTACINDTTLPFAHPHLPFGGIGNSGIGRAHGYYGFLAFSN